MSSSLVSSASRQSQGPLLDVSGVTKGYPRGRWLRRLLGRSSPVQADALSGVSFQVHRGEIVGLLGPNGAGKTTLLKIISTMLYPSTGRVSVAGQDVSRTPVLARRKLGLVTSDERSFYWRLTGWQNLEFFAALYEVPHSIAGNRIAELLENLGLAHAAHQSFYSYSSGMKQKMAIARGLLASPELVLYDEPTRALDPLSTRNIRQWLKRNQVLAPHTAHVIATNQMAEAEQLCDRVIVLNRGRIIADGSIAEIRSRFQEHAVHRILCAGLPQKPVIEANPAGDVFEIHRSESEAGTELRVHTSKNGSGLSRVLTQVLGLGATVVRCDMVEMPLDDVICSMVLEDQPPPAVFQESAP